MRFASENKRVELHGVDTFDDYFEVDNVTYQALPLDEKDSTKGLGINSSVFRAVEAESNDSPSLVVKVCNFADDSRGEKPAARRDRFKREIRAMQLSLQHGKENVVVRLRGVGEVRVNWMYKERTRKRMHQCFLIEPAEQNLGEYLEKEIGLTRLVPRNKVATHAVAGQVDHIFFYPKDRLDGYECWVENSRQARQVSDHLPVIAEITFH